MVYGKSVSVDTIECSNWIKNLSVILANFFFNEIFNGHKTDLFFKCLPDETSVFKAKNVRVKNMVKSALQLY